MKISLIIPFYDENDNVAYVLEEIRSVMADTDMDCEIIAVDDGSRDGTKDTLLRYAQTQDSIKVLAFTKNLGKDAALFAGLACAQGELIVMMDGDGQYDFHDVVKMLPELDHVDAVFGSREERADPRSKIIVSRIAYFFRRLVLGDDVRDTGCGLKVMKRHTLQSLLPMRGVHRFIPVLFKLAGYSYKVMPVHHRSRAHGRSKFSLKRLYFVSTIIDFIFIWWFKVNYIGMNEQEARNDRG
ncbi:MAG: glycosyltransferase family 2 protein [Candidatus Omnitrophota bacterium]|jgi:glycosyltransferase involved in cell wall biosynthesis